MLVTAETPNARLRIDFDKEEHYVEYNEEDYTYRELDALMKIAQALGIEEMDEDECASEFDLETGNIRIWCAEIPHQIPRHVREGRAFCGTADTEQG